METRTVRLGDFATFVNEKCYLNEASRNTYVSTENLKPNRLGVFFPITKLPQTNKVNTFAKGDILIANIRPYFKKIWHANIAGTHSTDVLNIRSNSKQLLQSYLAVVLSDDRFFDYMMATSKGTKMPRGDKKAIMDFKFELPSFKDQIIISDSISVINQKIELNRQINKNLLKLSVLGFNKWLDSTQSNQYTSLDKIASFKNGIAMQKFSPTDKIHVLPVIKIRELNQGYIDSNSDSVTSVIDDDVKVHNGDLVFSWSGTLSAKIWTDGDAALNQHLFKVTSNRWPKWFYYLWVLHHLNTFRGIAADKKTTMGHIKRKDLTNAKVLIPNAKEFKNLDTILNPIIEQMVNGGIESKNLIDIRNILLPKLLSGSMDLSSIEETINND